MHARDHLSRRSAVGDIRLNEQCRAALLLNDRLDLFGGGFVSCIVDGDLCALLCKPNGDRTTNAARTARNKSNFSLKKHTNPPSSQPNSFKHYFFSVSSVFCSDSTFSTFRLFRALSMRLLNPASVLPGPHST